jgi:NDP-sugar pyrophosphorylase family protein
MRVIIPAAGKGIRFRELGKQYPKAILPYKNKPILVHNIERLLRVEDVSDIVVTVGHQSEKIVDCLSRYFPNELQSGKILTVDNLDINNVNGPAVSILNGMLAGESNFDRLLVILGDLYLENDFPKFELNSSFVGVQEVPDFARWCLVRSKDEFVTEIVDKPITDPNTSSALNGIYYFHDGAAVFDLAKSSIAGSEAQCGRDAEISGFLAPYCQKYSVRLNFNILLRDFGTLEEYLSNRDVTPHRTFNTISMPTPNTVKKSTIVRDQSPKIIREALWFECIPEELKLFTPRLINRELTDPSVNGFPSYTLERILLPTLREIFVFLESDTKFWTIIFEELKRTIECFQGAAPDLGSTYWSDLAGLSHQRFQELPLQYQSIDYSVELSKVIPINLPPDSIFHGDMTLSNIFFDERNNQIKLIDPSGPLIGNTLYDLAKLMSCFYYNYDFIDAEMYSLPPSGSFLYNDGKQEVGLLFNDFVRSWIGPDLTNFVHYLSSLQFLNMIPLHSHNEKNQELFFERHNIARETSGLAE